MALTLQDKLALSLTSAGSMRNLAAMLGVSHQRAGRWLKEGDEGGVKKIPIEAKPLIDFVYGLHKQVTREQAKVDRIPFDAKAPVYAERRPLRTGAPGDRVVAEHTHYIRQGVRQQVMRGAQASGEYYQASVRSVINLKRYFRDRAVEEIERTGRDIKPGHLANEMFKSFARKEEAQRGRIIEKTEPFPLYTMYQGMGRTMTSDASQGIEHLLQQKHSPAVEGEGTRFADQFLFQTYPQNYVEPQKPIRASKGNRSRAASRKRAK